MRWLVLLLLASPASAAVRDAKRDFSFNVPDGYADFPEGMAPGTLYSYSRGSDDARFIFRLEGLRGTISREPLIHATVESSAKKAVEGSGVELTRFDYRGVKWKGLDLDLVVTYAQSGARRSVILGTQIPLQPEAVQIFLMGPASEEARLLADHQAILSSFEGKSSWLTDEQRSERLGMFAGAALVGLLVLAQRLWRRKGAA